MQNRGYAGETPGRSERFPSDLDCLERAIEKLKSFHDDYRGLVETVACGTRAIPALRTLLFEREPGGLFQTQGLAVKALAALKAYDVLIEFLKTPREATDPVERIGDEVVTSAAARALASLREPHVFELSCGLPKPGLCLA